jgi:Na+/H+ antiporter NhaD/arsenite permease-like protein
MLLARYGRVVDAAIGQAAAQAWPPFVLVAGLLLIGSVVEADGLFAALGTRIERVGGGPVALLATLLGLEAIVTAVLNLDTAVVFLTPIIIHAAGQRDCDVRSKPWTMSSAARKTFRSSRRKALQNESAEAPSGFEPLYEALQASA